MAFPRLKPFDLTEIDNFLSYPLPEEFQQPLYTRYLKSHADHLLAEVKALQEENAKLKHENEGYFKSQIELAQAVHATRQQRDTLEYVAKLFDEESYDDAQARTDLMWALLGEVWIQHKAGRLSADSRLVQLFRSIQQLDRKLQATAIVQQEGR